MEPNKYWDEYPSAVTVSDHNGTIIYMNKKAADTFKKWGGLELIGKSLYDYHNENSTKIIREILTSGKPNTYTIDKSGKKKLVHQSPWFLNGKVAGLTEISIELPDEMNHIIR